MIETATMCVRGLFYVTLCFLTRLFFALLAPRLYLKKWLLWLFCLLFAVIRESCCLLGVWWQLIVCCCAVWMRLSRICCCVCYASTCLRRFLFGFFFFLFALFVISCCFVVVVVVVVVGCVMIKPTKASVCRFLKHTACCRLFCRFVVFLFFLAFFFNEYFWRRSRLR